MSGATDPSASLPVLDGDTTVFVDRDGVINERIVGDYVRTRAQFVLLPDALTGLRMLADHAGLVIVVTNQAGVGRGLIDPAELERIHELLVRNVQEAGGRIDAIMVCPHGKDAGCDCRKPGTGLARQAAARFSRLDLARAVMIGDSSGDIAFAHALGIPSVLVTGTGGEGSGDDGPTATAPDLLAAAHLLLDH